MPFSTSFINVAPLLLPSPRPYRFRCPQACFSRPQVLPTTVSGGSDGSGHLPECTLNIHRDRRRSLWTPFRPCPAPSVPILGWLLLFYGGHLQLDHGWNSAESKTYGCKHWVKGCRPQFSASSDPLDSSRSWKLKRTLLACQQRRISRWDNR